jgi:hypothetical protein
MIYVESAMFFIALAVPFVYFGKVAARDVYKG